MKTAKAFVKKSVSVLLATAIVMTMSFVFSSTTFAADANTISYTFSGSDSAKAGYAEGIITLSSNTGGAFHLYWADSEKALDGYYEIATLNVSAGGKATFKFDNNTAIPKGAVKLIAVKNTVDKAVSKADAVYDIPVEKRLEFGSGDLLYKFNSYSDVHIDDGGYYKNAERNWKQALKFGVDKGTSFIVSSGDMVTNASGPDGEWMTYEKILADSDYLGSVWEANGNHDLRSGVSTGLTSFVRASGTDNTIANFDANKPYYYVTEKTTGDVFIFMALEKSSDPSSCDEFSTAQMTWLTNLLKKYYGTGVNIYLIEHSPINGFGAGDRMSKPYYKAHLSQSYYSTAQLKSLLMTYPKIIWMSGHTHEDFSMGYNYSNENNTACHMIHNPSVAGSTWASEADSSLDYKDGYGYNSQGYYVEAYENEVVYYGANIIDELIYPKYCYIMDGARNTSPGSINPTVPVTTQVPTQATGSTIPSGVATNRFYFANTLRWEFVDCYSWSTDDTSTCVWPGYAAAYYATTEQGTELYYCDIPASHENIIWNNGGNGYQTVDITPDGVNNFYTPSTSVNSKSVPVKASVWDYDPPTTDPIYTEPVETTAPITTLPVTTQPVTTVPATTQPITTQPVTTVPAPTQPITTQPATTVPAPTQPITTQPVTTVPATTQPITTQPVTTVPAPTQPITTQPVTTVPATTQPITTQPATTVPATTQPITTIPEITEPRYQYGDTDMDGVVSIMDATLIQQHITELVRMNEEQIILGDVDFDGFISIKDATTIQMYIAQLISGFEKPQPKSKSADEVSAKSLVQELAFVKTELDARFTFASYDQYQDLKRLYYKYRNQTSVTDESSVVSEFELLTARLDEIAQHIGAPVIYQVRDIYYFENTYNWSTVKCYAWNGSSEYAVWPGVNMQKIGTNNGHDVYGVRFEYAGQFTSLIFNNGSEQTVNIALNTYEHNAFRLSGTSTDGKLNVTNFNYNSSTEPTTAPITTKPVADNKRYSLCYYNGTAHDWNKIDTYLVPQSNGTYTLDFTATNSSDISLNIYDNSTAKYNCVAASSGIAYTSGLTETYSLVSSSSRGKSITISSLSAGAVIKFVYTPSFNTLKITFGGTAQTEPSETDNSQYVLCYYNGTAHGWNSFDTYLKNSGNGTYSLDFVTKNSSDISLNIYDISSARYNCVASSTPLAYSQGAENNYTLNSSSSRGKSITISGLSTGMVIKFVYMPSANTLKITFGGTAQTEPAELDNNHYVLCYYNGTAHGWNSFDTYFKDMGNGTYSLDFVTVNSSDISLNIYDVLGTKYNCVASSTPLTYSSGAVNSYALSSSSSRGKSITISGLSAGVKINFSYKPSANSLVINFK